MVRRRAVRPVPASRLGLCRVFGHARRGFSVLEAVLVLALIGFLFAVTVPRLGSSANPAASDSAARGSLGAFMGAQDAVFARDLAFSSDPATLAGFAPTVSFVVSPTPSGEASQVSVAVSGGYAGAAALSSSGSCWYLRVSYAAAADAEPVLWAVDDSPSGCSGADALALDPPEGVGATPDAAYVLS